MHEHHHAAWARELSDVDPVSLQVFTAFKRAMVLQRQHVLKLMSEHGSHPAQAGCLRLLSGHAGLSQREIATYLHVSPPTVTTMLQKMEKAELIERRTDEIDQRLTRIYLTKKGTDIQEGIARAFKESIDIALGSMPEADRLELTRLLDAVSTNIEASLGTSVDEGAHPTC